MNTSGSSGIVEYSFPMWSKKHVGTWLDAFKPRRSSRGSVSSSGSNRSSMISSSGKASRSGSLGSIFSRRSSASAEEQERLMVDEPVQRKAYVPSHASKDFMKTTTTHEIRVNSEIL